MTRALKGQGKELEALPPERGSELWQQQGEPGRGGRGSRGGAAGDRWGLEGVCGVEVVLLPKLVVFSAHEPQAGCATGVLQNFSTEIGIYMKTKIRVSTKPCAPVPLAALYVIAKNGNQPRN